MVLQDYKIDGEYICISKKELEELRDHYLHLGTEKYHGKLGYYYVGKHTVMCDLLKMFEPLMG